MTSRRAKRRKRIETSTPTPTAQVAPPARRSSHVFGDGTSDLVFSAQENEVGLVEWSVQDMAADDPLVASGLAVTGKTAWEMGCTAALGRLKELAAA